MIRRILLDLDDVCNQFSITALKFVGCNIERYGQFPVEMGYNLVGAANRLVGYERFTVPSFWDSIPREFWATVPRSTEYPILLGLCEALVGRDNVALLTSPTIDPDCLAGKLEWVHSFAPKWLHRQFLVGPCKHFCAHPEALLIDDADKNVVKFEAWGGRSLLVPRPWNTLHHLNTLDYIYRQFDRLFDENNHRGFTESPFRTGAPRIFETDPTFPA